MAVTVGAATGEGADKQPVKNNEEAKIPELQGWHRAKESASRHNRNLLQYAAAIAVVLGVEGGSGGILAVALALWKAGATTEATTQATTEATTQATNEASTWVFGALAGFLPGWAMCTIVGVVGTGVLAVVLLTALLIRALWYRQKSERQADSHRDNIIAMDPNYFPPERQ